MNVKKSQPFNINLMILSKNKTEYAKSEKMKLKNK